MKGGGDIVGDHVREREGTHGRNRDMIDISESDEEGCSCMRHHMKDNCDAV